MKILFISMFLTVLAACQSINYEPTSKNLIQSVVLGDDDSNNVIKVKYYGMSRQYAEKLVEQFSKQRNNYPPFWTTSFLEGSSVKAYFECSGNDCDYSVVISMRCKGSRSLLFHVTQEYPEVSFQYVGEGAKTEERCFVSNREWWDE